MRVQKTTILLFGASIVAGTQFLGAGVGLLAAVVAFLWAFVMTYATVMRYVPAILILTLPSYIGIRSLDHLFFVPELNLAPVTLSFLGTDWPTTLAVMGGAFIRVAREVLRPVSPLWRVFPKLLLVGFFAAIAFALLSAYEGYANDLNRFSQGVRGILALSGVFWGILLIERSAETVGMVLQRIRNITVAGGALILTDGLRGHLYFLNYGLAAGLVGDSFRRRNWVGSVVLILVVLVAMTQGTLTTGGIVVVAIILVLVAAIWPARKGSLWKMGFAVGAPVTTLAFLAFVIWSGADIGMEGYSEARERPLIEYIEFKTFADRRPLWSAAANQIGAGPYIVVPSGRNLYVPGVVLGGVDGWEFGAHNAILEIIRHNGVLSGVWAVALILYVLVAVGKSLFKARDQGVQGLAAAVLAVGIVGVTTGNFPVRDVGFFLWALAGVVLVLAQQQTGRPSGVVEYGKPSF